MTNKEAFALLQREKELSNLTGWSFVRELMFNFDAIRKEYNMAQEYLKPSKEIQEIVESRHKILYKYAEKDDNGKPVIISDNNGNNSYKIPDDVMEEAEKELKELEANNQDAINASIDNYKKYDEILNEEFKGTFNKINTKVIPKDIAYEQVQIIKYWIEM